jgi:hypothetical protein
MPPSVDCVVKAGVSEKVDDHLTASAMMTNDHQQLIRREVIGLRRNLRHRNMQSAVQSANIKLSRLPDIENRKLLPSAAHVSKLANREHIYFSERFCGHGEIAPLTYTTAVHMSDWKQDKKHSAASRSLGQILAEIDMHQRGFYLPGYSDGAHLALLGEATRSLSGSVLSGELKVDVGHRFPMNQGSTSPIQPAARSGRGSTGRRARALRFVRVRGRQAWRRLRPQISSGISSLRRL